MIAIFFIADRCLKALAIGRQDMPAIKLVGNFFSFDFTPNYFIAFSLPLRGFWLNLIIFLIILAIAFFLISFIKKKEKKISIIGLSLILTGAISNLIDRISGGFVVDYLYLKYFTVFNLADVCISAGAILLLIHIIIYPKKSPN